MAKDFFQFMEDALGDDSLRRAFEDKYNELYHPPAGTVVADPDKELSDWFWDNGYAIPKGQCKKIKPPFDVARGGPDIRPQY